MGKVAVLLPVPVAAGSEETYALVCSYVYGSEDAGSSLRYYEGEYDLF